MFQTKDCLLPFVCCWKKRLGAVVGVSLLFAWLVDGFVHLFAFLLYSIFFFKLSFPMPEDGTFLVLEFITFITTPLCSGLNQLGVSLTHLWLSQKRGKIYFLELCFFLWKVKQLRFLVFVCSRHYFFLENIFPEETREINLWVFSPLNYSRKMSCQWFLRDHLSSDI